MRHINTLAILVSIICIPFSLPHSSEAAETTLNKQTKYPAGNYTGDWRKVSALSIISAHPTIPPGGTTGADGKITIPFTSGSFSKNKYKDLWVEVKYDGKTQYWQIKPAPLSADGRSAVLQMPARLNGKTVQIRLFALDAKDKQTNMTNTMKIKVSASGMPTLPANGKTDPNGNITIAFASGSLSKSKLSGLWAEAAYDGKTEYWDLKTAALSADGKSVTLKMGENLDGKTVNIKLYGIDTSGRQTAMTNAIKIQVSSKPSSITMPSLPQSGKTDAAGKIIIRFTSGNISPKNIKEIWAEVTEYWDIGSDALSADGTAITLTMPDTLSGKTPEIKIYGIDTAGKQTRMSNTMKITVQ
jgi:hypothetical protein